MKHARQKRSSSLIEQCRTVIQEAVVLRKDIRAAIALNRLLLGELRKLSRSWVDPVNSHPNELQDNFVPPSRKSIDESSKRFSFRSTG